MTVATMPESRSSASPQLTVAGLVERHGLEAERGGAVLSVGEGLGVELFQAQLAAAGGDIFAQHEEQIRRR